MKTMQGMVKGIALIFALSALSASAAVVLNFDDGTAEGFTTPTGGTGTWVVKEPSGNPWDPGDNGALWQTDDTAAGQQVYLWRPSSLVGDTQAFRLTTTVHPVSYVAGTSRMGIILRSTGVAATDQKLALMLDNSGFTQRAALLSEAVAFLGTTPFGWSPGNDYTLRLSVNGPSVLGEIWTGTTTIGAPAVSFASTSSVQISAQGIGLYGAGVNGYFDNVQLEVIIPEPSTVALLAVGGLVLWRRRK